MKIINDIFFHRHASISAMKELHAQAQYIPGHSALQVIISSSRTWPALEYSANSSFLLQQLPLAFRHFVRLVINLVNVKC